MFYSTRGQQEWTLAVWKTAYSLSLTRWTVAVTVRSKITPSLIIYRLHDLTAAGAVQDVCGWSGGKVCMYQQYIYIYIVAAAINRTALVFNNCSYKWM